MDFKVGDTVVEPTIGVCTIEGLKRMTVDGKSENYFIFHSGNAKIMVPQSQIEKRGVRKPMSESDIKKILRLLKQPVSPARTDPKQQYNLYRDTMKSGDPVRIAKLLRDLFLLDQSFDLKGKEKEIMENAKKFLIDEISSVRDTNKVKVEDQIDSELKAMYKKKVAKERAKTKKS